MPPGGSFPKRAFEAASQRPSGDHESEASRGNPTACPPSGDTRQIASAAKPVKPLVVPEKWRKKATCVPSGDQAG
jgi:hypothetical protein